MLFQLVFFLKYVALCEPYTSVAQYVHMFVIFAVIRDIGQGRVAAQNEINHLCKASTWICTCGYVQRHLEMKVSAMKAERVVVPTGSCTRSHFCVVC